MFDKMKQLMEMKKQADEIKRQLDGIVVEASDVKGFTFRINGSQKFLSASVDAELLKPENKPRFEADLLRGINAAIHRSQMEAAVKMKSALPGFPGM